MPAKKPDMYECVEGFATADGISVAVGDLVRTGHPIMKNRDWAFKPFAGPRFEVEQATSAPGEKRGDKVVEEKRAKPVEREPERIEQATAAPGEKRGS